MTNPSFCKEESRDERIGLFNWWNTLLINWLSPLFPLSLPFALHLRDLEIRDLNFYWCLLINWYTVKCSFIVNSYIFNFWNKYLFSLTTSCEAVAWVRAYYAKIRFYDSDIQVLPSLVPTFHRVSSKCKYFSLKLLAHLRP